MDKTLHSLLSIYGKNKKFKCSLKKIMKLKFGPNKDIDLQIDKHFNNL